MERTRVQTAFQRALGSAVKLHQAQAQIVRNLGIAKYEQAKSQLEVALSRFWILMAELRAEQSSNWIADLENPGYVSVKVGSARLQVPFHALPSIPEENILDEIARLAQNLRLGDEQSSVICISGSVLYFNEFLQVGDIDFCEYIDSGLSKAAAAESVRLQVISRSATRYVIGVTTREDPENVRREIMLYEFLKPQKVDLNEWYSSLEKLMKKAFNCQAIHLVDTNFAGVIEATNWIVFWGSESESARESKLSFAHQEAPLGTWNIRPLFNVESLAVYVEFLILQITKYEIENPTKCLKRVVPLMRLFGEKKVIDVIVHEAHRFRLFEMQSIKNRIDLVEKFGNGRGLEKGLQRLLQKNRIRLRDQLRALGWNEDYEKVVSRINSINSQFLDSLNQKEDSQVSWIEKNVIEIAKKHING